MLEFFIMSIVIGFQLIVGALFAASMPLTDTILIILIIYTIICAWVDIPLIEILQEGRY